MQSATSPRDQALALRKKRRANKPRRRRIFFEVLEARTVMAPLGAFPDDTGEYMLGDVLVTVVLMESDPSLPGADFNSEDWNATTISAVQGKVQAGMDWWKQTLTSSNEFYNNPALPLLNFKYDWTWALDPAETLYEPINRYSSAHELWINDFLDRPDVNFAQSLDIYKDVKAFNNFQRERHHTDWAFTIFVVNSTNDTDDFFPLNPSPAPDEVNYRGAFAFLGGQFLVIPSDRPAMTFAHETGHIFYALDEYSTGHSYSQRSGYYNTQNTNGANGNPTPNFLSVQQPSIMATGSGQTTAWLNHVASDSSKSAIGWLDSDGDGVMDALDVPFSLKGSGSYNPAAGQYKFTGTSSVRTSANRNTFGGQNTNVIYNDISINKIRRAQYALDGGAWNTIADFANTPTTAALDLTINGIGTGAHTIKIRTIDTRTGATSEEFIGTINPANEATPPQVTSGGNSLAGFAFSDANANGDWDTGETVLTGWTVELRNIDDGLLTLAQTIEPSDFSENALLNTIKPGITLSAVGATAGGDLVMARTSIRSGVGKVFYAGSTANETFASIRNANGTALSVDRRLKISLGAPVTNVSLKAVSAAVGSGSSSVGRLEAYDINNNLIGRYTTSALGAGQSEVMTITHAAADIKYVIASGHLETEVLFDSLVVGPATSTKTGVDGSFSLGALPPGTYDLKVVAAPNYIATNPDNARMSVTVPANGAGPTNLYFGFQFGGNPWHNLPEPLNVNATGGISAFDALLIINFINLNPTTPVLVASEAQPGLYIDVNNDNRCTAFDALAIINYLNLYGSTGSGAAPERRELVKPTPVQPTTSPPIEDAGESNGAAGVVAQTADEYFARFPIHISQIIKDTNIDITDDVDAGPIDLVTNVESGDEHFELPLLTAAATNRVNEVVSNLRSSNLGPVANRVSAVIAPLLNRLRELQPSHEDSEDESLARPRATTARQRVNQLLELLAHDLSELVATRERLPRNPGS